MWKVLVVGFWCVKLFFEFLHPSTLRLKIAFKPKFDRHLAWPSACNMFKADSSKSSYPYESKFNLWPLTLKKSTTRWGVICSSPQRGSANWMQEILDAHCKLQNHLTACEVSLSTTFQHDSFYSYGVMLPNVIFDLFALSDPKIQDGHFNMNRHLDWP